MSKSRVQDSRCCPKCGYSIPTDDYWDTIFPDEIHYCYHCGQPLTVQETEAGTEVKMEEET